MRLIAPGQNGCGPSGFPRRRLWLGIALCAILAVPVEGGRIVFSKPHLIAHRTLARTLVATDLDRDGRLDIALGSRAQEPIFQGVPIVWYRGEGTRGAPRFGEERPVTVGHPYPLIPSLTLAVGDLDGDGDEDIVSGEGSIFPDHIACFESDGGAEPLFTPHILVGDVIGAWFLKVLDFDHDGDLDVLYSSEGDDKVAWLENDGASEPGFQEHVITEDPDGRTGPFRGPLIFARGGDAADFDGDGDLDVVAAGTVNDRVAWFENKGVGSPFVGRTITRNADEPLLLQAADINGDGHVDVLVVSFQDDALAWYENDGLVPPSFSEHVIAEDPDGPGGPLESPLGGGVQALAVDVDGDGDQDIIAAVFVHDVPERNRVLYLENDGASPPGFTIRVVTSELWGPWALAAADLDQDGDLDLLAAEGRVGSQERVVWIENLATLPTSAGQGPPR